MTISRGISWGRLWGLRPPGITKGVPKKEKGKEEKTKKKEGKKGKTSSKNGGQEEQKEKTDSEANQHEERGAFQVRDTPSYFVFCRDRVSDFVWVPQAKECTKLCKLTPKLHFFSTSEGAHSPQTPLVSIGAEVLSVLN